MNRNINLSYLFAFIRNLDMASSIWVLYLAYKGMSLLEIGILEGIYHVTSMVFEIPSGALADLLGRKKTIVAGRVGITLSCICMLLADGFWGFALGFFLQAFSNTLNSGADEALLYDSMKLCGREGEFLKVSGRLNILVEISQAIAVVVGGILAEYSYGWCYGVSIFVAMLGFMVAMFLRETPIAVEKEVDGITDRLEATSKEPSRFVLGQRLKSHFITSINILRGNKKIRNFVVYYSAIFTTYTLLFFYSQQYFADMGLNKVCISLIMLVAGVVSCLGAAYSEKLYGWLGERIAHYGAMVIALCIAAFGFGNLRVAVGA